MEQGFGVLITGGWERRRKRELAEGGKQGWSRVLRRGWNMSGKTVASVGKRGIAAEKGVERGIGKAKLRALCLADVHSSNTALAAVGRLVSVTKPDLVFVAGDITHRGSASFASDFLDAIAKAIKANNLKTRIFAVHGNMDPLEVQKLLEERKISVHNRGVQFKGHYFVGFGGSTHTPHGTPCEYHEDDIKNALEKLVDRKTVLLAHSPPYGTKADWTGSDHIGSRALREVVEERRAIACVCAHAHEAKGVEKLGVTKIIKVPPLNAGEAAFLELPSLRTRFIETT